MTLFYGESLAYLSNNSRQFRKSAIQISGKLIGILCVFQSLPNSCNADICHMQTIHSAGDVPTDRFQVVDDLGMRTARGLHINEFVTTRAARFQLKPQNESDSEDEVFYDYEFLDELMYQVPGVC